MAAHGFTVEMDMEVKYRMVMAQLNAVEGMTAGSPLREFLERFPSIRNDFLLHNNTVRSVSVGEDLLDANHHRYFLGTTLRRTCTRQLVEMSLRGELRDIQLLTPGERCLWDYMKAVAIEARETNGGRPREAAECGVEALDGLLREREAERVARALWLEERAAQDPQSVGNGEEEEDWDADLAAQDMANMMF